MGRTTTNETTLRTTSKIGKLLSGQIDSGCHFVEVAESETNNEHKDRVLTASEKTSQLEPTGPTKFLRKIHKNKRCCYISGE
jgi:hypothetical protein